MLDVGQVEMDQAVRLLVVYNRDFTFNVMRQVQEHLLEKACVRHQVSIKLFEVLRGKSVGALLGRDELSGSFQGTSKVEYVERLQCTLQVSFQLGLTQLQELQRVGNGYFGASRDTLYHVGSNSRCGGETDSNTSLALG